MIADSPDSGEDSLWVDALPRWGSMGGGDQFFTYLKDSFDVLYAEGETSPKMMSVGPALPGGWAAGSRGRADAVSRLHHES
jgi:hypothetical protein